MKQTTLIGIVIAMTCAGCATSTDVSYQYTRHGAECAQLTQEIAQQRGDSEYKRSLSRRYYQNCVGN